jgi:hypothetical protein
MTRRWMTVALALVAMLATTLGMLTAPADASTASVKKWQTRLNALHCDAGPADGKSGTWTRSAILRFQSRHALAQTGSVNAATRTRLFAANAQRCDVRRVPARSGSGRRIVLSQKQNWVWVIGAKNQVLRQGGIVDNPGALHKGTYRTGSYCGRAARVKRNSSGSLWLDHFVRFAPCGFGFHRIPRAMSNGRQIHADNLLGTNLAQSHGCIRLSASMATRIWNFTSSGTTVVRVL